MHHVIIFIFCRIHRLKNGSGFRFFFGVLEKRFQIRRKKKEKIKTVPDPAKKKAKNKNRSGYGDFSAEITAPVPDLFGFILRMIPLYQYVLSMFSRGKTTKFMILFQKCNCRYKFSKGSFYSNLFLYFLVKKYQFSRTSILEFAGKLKERCT